MSLPRLESVRNIRKSNDETWNYMYARFLCFQTHMYSIGSFIKVYHVSLKVKHITRYIQKIGWQWAIIRRDQIPS